MPDKYYFAKSISVKKNKSGEKHIYCVLISQTEIMTFDIVETVGAYVML